MYVISSYPKIQVNLKYILLNERNQSVRIHTLWLWLHDILEKAKLKIVSRSVITRAFNRWIIGEVFRAVKLFCMPLMVVMEMQDSALIKNHQVVSACFKVWAAQVYHDPRISRWYGSRLFLPMQETQETWVRSLGRKDLLEKEVTIHSSILAWRIPWREKPGGLQFMGSQKGQIQLSDWAPGNTLSPAPLRPP